MKIKRKKLKKKKAKDVDSDYPEENNPFVVESSAAEVLTSASEDKQGFEENVLIDKIKKPKKKKSKKIKKSKKFLKLKGKKKRAISNAVLEEIKEERSNSINNCHLKYENKNNNSLSRSSKGSDENKLVKHNIANSSQNKENLPSILPPKDQIPSMKITVSHIVNDAENQNKLNAKNKKVQRKPSEGDLKSLRKKREKQKTESTNPFEESEVKEIVSVTSKEGEPDTRNRSHSKRHRTSSMLVSSRKRTKKKRLKILRRIRGKKKRKDTLDAAAASASYNPTPGRSRDQNRINQIIEDAEEVKEVMAVCVQVEVEKRHSRLNEVMESVEFLEQQSFKLAKTTQEIRMKKQTQASCCGGFFAKYRRCWFICTCERGLNKRKKYNSSKKNNNNNNSRADSSESDDDDAYELQGSSGEVSPVKMRNRNKIKSESSSRSESQKLIVSGETRERRASSSSLLINLQHSRLLQNFRTSTSSLDTIEKNNKSRKESQKSSPTPSLEELLQRKPNVNKKTEKRISKIIAEYQDAEKQKSAAELLLIDHE